MSLAPFPHSPPHVVFLFPSIGIDRIVSSLEQGPHHAHGWCLINNNTSLPAYPTSQGCCGDKASSDPCLWLWALWKKGRIKMEWMNEIWTLLGSQAMFVVWPHDIYFGKSCSSMGRVLLHETWYMLCTRFSGVRELVQCLSVRFAMSYIQTLATAFLLSLCIESQCGVVGRGMGRNGFKFLLICEAYWLTSGQSFSLWLTYLARLPCKLLGAFRRKGRRQTE